MADYRSSGLDVSEAKRSDDRIAEDDTRALLPDSDTDADGEQHESEALSRWSRLKQHPATQFLLSWWRTIFILSVPLLFLPLPLLWKTQASKALYVIVIMAMYWVTEVVPIAITALLPLILFPGLGVLPPDDVARNYLKDSNMLFLGGLMMAVAIERWNLHKRMALLVLRLVGSQPKWLLLGFMSTTAFLSMWISNTATAAMMLPIAQAVLLEIKEESDLVVPESSLLLGGTALSDRDDNMVSAVRYTRKYNSTGNGLEDDDSSDGGSVVIDDKPKDKNKPKDNNNNSNNYNNDRSVITGADRPVDGIVADSAGSGATPPSSLQNKRFNRLAKSLMLGVAYSANIGGTGTLTGTGPNIVLAGLAHDLGVNFGLWFVFATPAMVLALVLSWLYLSAIYCDDSFQTIKRRLFGQERFHFNGKRAKAVIKQQYNKLGRIRYAEVVLLCMFHLLVLLWLFREPRFIPGFGSFFKQDEDDSSYVSDSTVVIFIVFLLCVIPSEPCCCSWNNLLKAGSSPRLLDWDSIQRKVPWNVVFLLGSGFAIANAAEESGLSEFIGNKLTVFEDLPREVIALLISFLVAGLTEVMSNVATATLFLPILRSLGENLCIHPLYLMIPATVSASYAFMVPVATPPNAIAFSYGYIKVYNMMATGVFMNILCVGIVTLALNTTGVPLFKLNHFPGNSTACDSQNGTIALLDT